MNFRIARSLHVPREWPFARIHMWLVAVVLAHVPATTSLAMDFMAGVDISALHLLEENGATYSDNGVPGDPVEIMVDHGVNWARLRLFLDADGQYLAVQDLEYTLQQALEIQASAPDMKFLLDFHYSDTWADPGKQFKPAAWAGQSGVQLQNTVRDYTRDTIIAFKDVGVMPDMVQIGNEISNGMIWPDGSTSNWNDFANLISAGINGARLGANDTSGSPAAPEPLMMIHTDKGGDPGRTDSWLDQLLPRLQANGTDPDVIGLSYYPIWHYDQPSPGAGNLAALRANLQHVADPVASGGHGKPVVIVEAGFASRGSTDTGWFEWPSESVENQRKYLEDMVTAVRDVDDDMGWGVFWWYAEAVPTPGLPGEIWMDGRFGLFDQDGDLLPAIDAFPDVNPAPDPEPPAGQHYREDFSAVGNLSIVNWSDTSIGAVNEAGVATSAVDGYLWWYNATSLAAATTVVGAVTTNDFDPISTSADGLTLNWEQRLEHQFNDSFQEVSGTPVDVRLAVEVDGQWYATAEVFTTTDTGVSSTGPWDLYSRDFDPAASEWLELTLSGSSVTLGAVADGDLAGELTGIGFVGTFAQYQTVNFNFVEISVAVPLLLPGDFNGDGVVDAADYTVWRDNLGTSFDLNGNGDESEGSGGVVDQADYDLWKAQFGTTTSGPGALAESAAVPEPPTHVILMLALGVVGVLRRRGGND
jgi:arabinogalactan endo-1,4-beta-galactosidase